jgi:quinol monooxygenase YgiN
MYIRVTRGSCDPAKWDDVIALQEEVIAASKQRPGFVSFQAAGDRDRCAVQVSTWDNEESAPKPLQEALGDLMTRILALVKIETSETYRVNLTA